MVKYVKLLETYLEEVVILDRVLEKQSLYNDIPNDRGCYNI